MIADLTTDFTFSLRFVAAGPPRLEWASAGLTKLTGYTLEELVERGDWPSLVHPDDLHRTLASVEALRAGQRAEAEVRLVTRSGEVRWVRYLNQPILDDERAAVVGFLGAAQDITQRKQVEEALRAGEERFARFMRYLPGLAWIKDAQGRYIYANDAAERAFQTPRERLYERTDQEIFPPQTAAQFEENDRRVREGGAGIQLVETLEHEDGVLHHSLVSKFPIPSADGRTMLVGGIAIDITPQMEVEASLRESEARFRHLAGAIPQIVWISRPDHTVEFYNERWFAYTGLTLEEAYAPEGWKAPVHPDDLARIVDAAAVTRGTTGPFEAEYRLRDRRGVYRWHLGRAVPVLDAGGNVVRRLGTATDIDDRKRAEHDALFLAEAGAALSALTDELGALERVARLAVPHFADWCAVDLLDDASVHQLVVAPSVPGRGATVNGPHVCDPGPDAFHRAVARVLGTGVAIAMIVPEIREEMLTPGTPEGTHLGRLHAHGVRSFLCVPLEGRGGPLGAIAFFANASGRRYGPSDLRLAEDLARRAAIAVENARLYDRLKEADRRKDVFLATLAHELRNPLAPIRNALHLMAHDPGDTAGHESERAMAERQVVHLSRLVDDLMDVARISRGKIELRPRLVDLAPIVRQATDVIRSAASERGLELSVELPEGPIPLSIDPTRIEQVLDNLLTNAIKYTDPGGRIGLTVARGTREVIVRVHDTGIGIAPAMLPRVFEMFVQAERQSDRAQGGLGIGLGLVKSLIELHGGAITAHSEGYAAGSEFVVRLPVPSPEATRSAPPEPEDPRRGQGDLPRRRILVVDDNVDAAKSLARVLTRLHGQEVRVAHNGPEALVLAEEFQPAVVLLDIGMPGMDGYEVARRLRAQPAFQTTLIAALTGWGQESDLERSRASGFDHHLVKPADPDAIRAVLAAAPIGPAMPPPEPDASA